MTQRRGKNAAFFVGTPRGLSSGCCAFPRLRGNRAMRCSAGAAARLRSPRVPPPRMHAINADTVDTSSFAAAASVRDARRRSSFPLAKMWRSRGCLLAGTAVFGTRMMPCSQSIATRAGRRGPAPCEALPDEISGLSYGAGQGNRAVSELSGRREPPQPRRQLSQSLPAATVTIDATVSTLALATLGSVSVCGTLFMLIMAPALKAMMRAAEAAERAATNAEKAMEEFEKLSAQTLVDLPRTLAECEAAAVEWDELGQELRELLGRFERWGQFSAPNAEEALAKLTSSVLEEPTRVLDRSLDEAENYIKRLSDDFSQAVNQLSGWERELKRELKTSVEQAAFSEAWEQVNERKRLRDEGAASLSTQVKLPSDYNRPRQTESAEEKLERLKDFAEFAATRRVAAQNRRKAVVDAIAAAEEATEEAGMATKMLLSEGLLNMPRSAQNTDLAAAVESTKVEQVTSALRNALEAVEEAKKAAEEAAAADKSWDEDEYTLSLEEYGDEGLYEGEEVEGGGGKTSSSATGDESKALMKAELEAELDARKVESADP